MIRFSPQELNRWLKLFAAAQKKKDWIRVLHYMLVTFIWVLTFDREGHTEVAYKFDVSILAQQYGFRIYLNIFYLSGVLSNLKHLNGSAGERVQHEPQLLLREIFLSFDARL